MTLLTVGSRLPFVLIKGESCVNVPEKKGEMEAITPLL